MRAVRAAGVTLRMSGRGRDCPALRYGADGLELFQGEPAHELFLD